MLEYLDRLLKSPTFRRMVVFAVGSLVVLLNQKIGLNLDPEQVGATVLLVLGYLAQSAAVDRARIIAASKAEGDAAAAKVATVDDAAKVLGGAP